MDKRKKKRPKKLTVAQAFKRMERSLQEFERKLPKASPETLSKRINT